jgi:hypothetical protein
MYSIYLHLEILNFIIFVMFSIIRSRNQFEINEHSNESITHIEEKLQKNKYLY